MHLLIHPISLNDDIHLQPDYAIVHFSNINHGNLQVKNQREAMIRLYICLEVFIASFTLNHMRALDLDPE